MTPLPLTLALFTSTRGHFGRDTYQTTVNDWLRQLPGHSWEALRANIKWEPDQEAKRDEMKAWLEARGFEVTTPCQAWKHHDASHQEGYLRDMALVVGEIATPYYLSLEDDMLLRADEPIEKYLAEAIELLEDNPALVQVRFARWANEQDRIQGLRAKHGIDAKVFPDAHGNMTHNDWSNNPFIARARDVNAALRFLFVSNLPRHSEHGLGAVMKIIGHPEQPFYTPAPACVYCRHIGTLPGEEDVLDKPIYST